MKRPQRVLLSYSGIIVLLILSNLPFIYNRTLAFVKTVKQIATAPFSTDSYKQNDRYQAVVTLHEKYPNYPIYFFPDSPEGNKNSILWQKVQSYYLLYPYLGMEITNIQDPELISKLSTKKLSAIVISPYEQPVLSSAEKQHPHAEYYLYLIHSK